MEQSKKFLKRLFSFNSIKWRAVLLWLFTILAVSFAFQKIFISNQKQVLISQVSDNLKDQFEFLKENGYLQNLSSTGAKVNFPVYQYIGNSESAKVAPSWPVHCAMPFTFPQNGQIFSAPCADDSQFIGLKGSITYNDNQPEDVLLWSIIRPITPATELTAGFIALLALITFIAGLKIYLPMRRMFDEITEVSKKMKKGDYDVKLPQSGLADIDTLVNAFNEMSQNILERDQYFFQTAYQDTLTGLDNRVFFLLRLNNHIENNQSPVSVVTWSIEGLGDVYDVLGQETVDQAIKLFATNALEIKVNAISLARIDSNVFAIAYPSKDHHENDFKLAHQLLKTEVVTPEYSLELKCHAGISQYPDDGQSAKTLLRRCEVARQKAIRTKQPIVKFEPAIERSSTERLAILSDLQQAIERNELELFLQPKLNLKTGKINHAEALIRWNHPTRGQLTAAMFIGVAEQSGIVKTLSHFGLNEVYRILNRVNTDTFCVSLNISPLDLEDDKLLETAKELHAKQPNLASQIYIEITESSTLTDLQKATDLLNEFVKMGFKISIDDFGTGYSSLAWLKRLPISELKIDRSLVQYADLNTDSSIILQSTIDMGHTMGLVVTVEGIETEGELQLTKNLGADYIQGYLISPPIPQRAYFSRYFSGSYSHETNSN